MEVNDTAFESPQRGEPITLSMIHFNIISSELFSVKVAPADYFDALVWCGDVESSQTSMVVGKPYHR